MKKIKILFVCMGNICRSPTAHALMQHKIDQQGLSERFEIDSAGTHGYHVGEHSDPRSRALAKQKNIDMDFIRARKISIHDYDEYDYILAMDEENLELIQYFAPKGYRAKISLFLHYANLAQTVVQKIVPDPYYGGEAGHEDVFQLVDKGCDALLDHVLSR